MMEVYAVYSDAMEVWGWTYAQAPELENVNKKKVPLILTSLIDCQLEVWKEKIEAGGWKEVCWYPSCHGDMTAYGVHLYMKEQPDAPLIASRDSFGLDLGCSVSQETKFVKVPDGGEARHGVIGIRRILKKYHPFFTSRKTWRHSWWKFATTPLATYWCWGLKPGEENRYRLEPRWRPKK